MRATLALLATLALAGGAHALGAPELAAPDVLAFRGDDPVPLEIVVTNRDPTAMDVTLFLRSSAAEIRAEPERVAIQLGPGEARAVALRVSIVGAAPGRFDLEATAIAARGDQATETSRLIEASWEAGAPAGGMEPRFVAAMALGAGAVVTLGAMLASPHWRPRLALPFLALYTRIRPSRVLDQPTRRVVHAAIAARPGISYTELRRATGLGGGALDHHLRILAMGRLVAEVRSGNHRLFALVGTAPPIREASPAEERILGSLAGDGLSQQAIADSLGISRQGAAWHLKRLEARSLVERAFVDGQWRWRRAPPAGRKD